MPGNGGLGDLLVAMLNMIGAGPTGPSAELLKGLEEYNPALYTAAVTLQNAAVKPIAASVLAVMLVLMLSGISARAQHDSQLAVQLIGAALFKACLVILVVVNATPILDAITGISVQIARAAYDAPMGGGGSGVPLGDQMRDDLAGADLMGQVGMMLMLLIPFLVSQLVSIAVVVLVFMRFLQLFILTCFAPLPLAFFGHEDTKSIAIGYLKRYAGYGLQGAMIILAVKLYQVVVGGYVAANAGYTDGDPLAFVASHFGTFLVGPLALGAILFGATALAKAVIGE